MTEPKHTPGPWTSSLMDCYSIGPTVFVVSNGDGNYVCEILDRGVEDADLALILAAPDMYEALEEVCIKCKRICLPALGVNCKCCETNKALRKARGEAE
jgi:phospholipid N-methyltransferase